MNILYYIWNENSSKDALEALSANHHQVIPFQYPMKDYIQDADFEHFFSGALSSSINCIFTFNFFPIISNIAEKHQIPYISWVYDCPHLTLYSDAVFNSVNRIYVFDKQLMQQIKATGCRQVHYHPLAANVDRLDRQLGLASNRLEDQHFVHEISFVGSLYENKMYDQIQYLSPYIKGYFDGIIQSQCLVQGIDFPSELLTSPILKDVSNYVKFDLGSNFHVSYKQIIVDMLNAKITSVERISLLNQISDKHKLALYTGSDKNLVPKSEYGGFISYTQTMPHVFRGSKINLNITLRSITSGIPLRAIDIMAAGGFLLSNYQPELDEYFENGKDCIMYTCPEELSYYIDYYLAHEKERVEIAYQGYQKVKKIFNYSYAFRELFSLSD